MGVIIELFHIAAVKTNSENPRKQEHGTWHIVNVPYILTYIFHF